MAKQSQAWKDLERATAEALKGKRVMRGANFAESDVDVKVPDFPLLKVDCKYRKSHAFHALVEDIRTKYCESHDVTIGTPVLVTRHRNGKNVYVTVDLEMFAKLLDLIREED